MATTSIKFNIDTISVKVGDESHIFNFKYSKLPITVETFAVIIFSRQASPPLMPSLDAFEYTFKSIKR